MYFLEEAAVGEARLTITDADGAEVDTFPSTIPAEKKDRQGLYITAAVGMNTFQWPMTYPSGVKMDGSEFHTRPGGPLAKPGVYHATLTVGDWSMTRSFSLLEDPRVDVSDDGPVGAVRLPDPDPRRALGHRHRGEPHSIAAPSARGVEDPVGRQRAGG